MPKDSRAFSEKEARQVVADAFGKQGREVDVISINYDRPVHWPPTDPGVFLTITVYFK
jgi:hypothetical protein